MPQVTVPSFAKLNIDLRVLNKRSDGYHELRTIFQTVSVQDRLKVEWTPSKKQTQIDLKSSLDIPDNLVVRAAKSLLDKLKSTGWVRMELSKRIPMGAGMGGGSSNAAAALLALLALIGKKLGYSDLLQIAESLGSDVPFFLHGGTALGLGRGTELYPLPDLKNTSLVIVSTGIHSSTPDAYRALNRTLTLEPPSHILREFQTIAWGLEATSLDQLPLKNDFEEAVFAAHPKLLGFVRKLRRLGAKPALMTGSGSALFGIFASAAQARAAVTEFPPGMAQVARFVSRRQYRQAWLRALGPAAQMSTFARESAT